MLKLVKSVVVLSLLLATRVLGSEHCPLLHSLNNYGEPVETIGEDVVITVDCSTVQPNVTWTYGGLSFPNAGRIEISYICTNSTQVIAQNTSEDFYPVTKSNGIGIPAVTLGSECTFTGCYSELISDGGGPTQNLYLLQSVNCTVDNVDECLKGEHNCDVNAECINTIGSFYCLCNLGYTGGGTECTNVDECALDQASCYDNAHCNDTVGGYNCTCYPGFEGDGFYCINIDECERDEHNCHDDLSHCEDNNGSYTCVCPLGYEWNGLMCKEHAMCSNTVGGYTCVCVDGYHDVSEEGGSGSGGERELNCINIDECDGTPDLCSNSFCIDTEGSYECSCLPGYNKTGGSQSCLNIDECKNGSDDCDSNAECTDTDGSYSCICNVGFEGDGSTCKRDSNTEKIGPIIGVLGIGSPAALILVTVVVVLIVLQLIMRRRRRRRKAAIYSDYRIFFKWRDVLNPDYAPVEVELRRVSDTPSMMSTFDSLDKSRKISIPKVVPEEDSISDTGSDQPLSSTEVPATTAPNSKETNKQRPKYIDIGFLDPSGVTENQPATPGTDLTPTSQHCVPKEVQRKIGQSPSESNAFLLSTPPARSTGYVASNHFEQKASSDYVVEARSEPTASSGYVVEARSEPTASSDYVVEAKSEPTAGSGYVVEARSEPTASSDYVVEAKSEPTAGSEYVVEARSEPTAGSGYVVEARSEPTAGSGYVVEARSEPTAGSGYVVEDSSMGVFEWTVSQLEGEGGGYLRERNIDQDIMATPTHALGDEYATAFPKPEPPNSISSDDSDGSEHLRDDECIVNLFTFEEVSYDAKGSSALNIDGYVEDSRADSGTPDSLADLSLLPSNTTPPQSDVQVVSIESLTLPLGSECVPSWQSSSQGSSYLREPTSRNHLMSISTDSGYIQENTVSSSTYSPDIYSPLSDVFVPPGGLESDSGYSGYSQVSTSSFEQSADAPLEVFAHEYSSRTQLPPTIHEGIAAEFPLLLDSQRRENLSSNYIKTDLSSSSMYVHPAKTYSLQHHGEGYYEMNKVPGSNTAPFSSRNLPSCNGYIH